MNALTFAALAEPNRLKIVELLRIQPWTVGEIADTLKLRQPQASKHLKILAEAGLVSVKPVAQQRVYSLNHEPFINLENWTDSFQAHWDQKLDSLELFINKE